MWVSLQRGAPEPSAPRRIYPKGVETPSLSLAQRAFGQVPKAHGLLAAAQRIGGLKHRAAMAPFKLLAQPLALRGKAGDVGLQLGVPLFQIAVFPLEPVEL